MIRKAIACIGMALTCATSPAMAKILVTTEGVGPVRIGMSPAEAEKAMGGKLDPPASTDPADQVDCWGANGPGPRYSHIVFGFWYNRLFFIELSLDHDLPELAVTRKGIHPGSSREELLRAYKSEDITRQYFSDQKDNEMYIRSEDYKRAIEFVINDNKVTDMIIGDTELIGGRPICPD